tara:strand:- start:4896 stop:5375 length:480 start_codon:yes stop_codon:yes gene_type:complete
MKTKFLILVTLLTLSSTFSFAQESLTGEIKMFAGNFAPRGWAFCDGQLLSISQNTALFSLLGTTYGGDGRTTFGLPDLRGRTAVHANQTNDVNNVRLGQKGGIISKNLLLISIPENVDKNSKKAKVLIDNGASNRSYTQSPYLGVNYIICLYGVYPSRN